MVLRSSAMVVGDVDGWCAMALNRRPSALFLHS